MGTILQAAELEVGDLVREHRGGTPLSPGFAHVRKIVATRTVNVGQTYQVLQTEDVEGRGLRGEINLSGTLVVEKLDYIPLAEVESVLRNLKPGEQLNIVYADGKFWA